MNYIEVKYIQGSNAVLKYYEGAELNFQCDAIVGKNGIGKTCEGDYKTPVGKFHLSMAFGNADAPDSKLTYLKVTEQHYWCADDMAYNQLVDSSKKKHKCSGEHLIEYPEAYKYAMVLDYNKECVLGLGSAIFLHCTVKGHSYTAGCIAVDETNMLRLLALCDENTEVWIH